jgi:hypothetical protein
MTVPVGKIANQHNMTDVSSGAVTAYPSGVPAFTTGV